MIFIMLVDAHIESRHRPGTPPQARDSAKNHHVTDGPVSILLPLHTTATITGYHYFDFSSKLF